MNDDVDAVYDKIQDGINNYTDITLSHQEAQLIVDEWCDQFRTIKRLKIPLISFLLVVELCFFFWLTRLVNS